MSTSHDDLRRLVDGHFGKGLSSANEARLRAHLPVCMDCRAAYQSYQAAERLDAEVLGPRERLAAALGLPSEARQTRLRAWRWGLGVVSALGAAALLLVVTSSHLATDPGHAIAARGMAIENAEPLEVAVFRMKGERDSMRVTEVVSPRDELAFAYRNEVGKSFLMIFAVDGAGHVAWYHPAWTDAADNPTAVPITKQVGFKELPEAVRQPLQGTSLTLYALFMDKPLDVRSVETRIARGEFTPDAAAGEVLRTMAFEVRP